MTTLPLKKILLVIDGLEFGGGERVFLQLASELKDRFEVMVAASTGRKFQEGVKNVGVYFYPVDMCNRFSLKPIRQLSDIIKSNKIDLVHSQGARADFFARIAGRMAGNPHNICTLAMPVDCFDVRPWQKMVYRTADKLTERFGEIFIVVSDSLKKMLIKQRGIPEHKVVRIYNGIECDQYQPNTDCSNSRKEWNISQESPVIAAIGRMVWQKGFEFLISAIPEVIQAVPDAKFLFVGEGPLNGKLGALSEELGVRDKVIFTGFRDDIKEVLSAIDLLVVPSLLEGFPMVTLEAMAMAKPIIATNIDGITEQITDEENGILVPPKNHNALSKAILRLIKDKDLSKRLGESARKKVEQEFSVEKMVEETEKVYTSLLGTN